MSYKRIRSLGEAARHGVLLQVTCANAACGRQRLISPFDLLGRFPASSSFAQIGLRLVCRGADLEGGGCGNRGAMVRFVDPDTPRDPPTSPSGGNVIPFTARRFAIDQPVRQPTRRRAARRSKAIE